MPRRMRCRRSFLPDTFLGVVTATTIIPVVGIVSYRALIRRDLLSLKEVATTAIIGAAVFVPLFTMFVRVARHADETL
jgi:hypothetical protein